MASRIKRVSATCALFVAALCGVASAVAQQGPRAVPVEVSEAEIRTMAPVSWVAGTVVSFDDANISAEVAGRLVKVADEGDQVKQGGVLARIDDVLIKSDLTAARAEVAREEANLTFLRREVERLQRLAKQNNAAQTQLEQTLSQRDASRNDLEAAKARLQIVQERLDRTVMRAPFAGVVVRRAKRAGEWVNAGDEVLQLVDADNLEIETTAPVTLRAYLTPGQQLAFKTERQQGAAKLRAVVPVADRQSRLLRLRLDITQGEWLAGEPVRVALPTALPQEVLSVPRDALVLRRGSSHVFKLNGESQAEQVFVQLGVANGNFIQVMGDLAAGDQVVIRGNERLRPGMAVNVKGGAAQ